MVGTNEWTARNLLRWPEVPCMAAEVAAEAAKRKHVEDDAEKDAAEAACGSTKRSRIQEEHSD